MAIKGLTDKASITPAYPMIGKLRKGAEMGDNTPGKELDHWRFTSNNPEIVKAFVDAYGEEPKELTVYIPYASPDQAFPNWCEIWGKTGLVHRCDGATMQIWLDGDHYERGSKPCPGGHTKGEPMNDVVGRLELVLPKLVEAGHVGVVIMETHSRHDLMNITKVLHQVFNDRNSPEGLMGIPFTLSRVAKEISVPGYGNQKGQRSRATKYLAMITPASQWVTNSIMNAIAAADQPRISAGPHLQLDAGPPEDYGLGEVVDEMDDEMTQWLGYEYTLADQAPIEDLAEMLWPDQYLEVMNKLMNTRTYNTPEKMREYISNRYCDLAQEYADGVTAPVKLIAHLDKGWPGLSDMYYELVAAFGRRPYPINVIKAFADLDQVIVNDPTLPDNRTAMGSVLLDKLCEAEGEEF